MKLVALVRPSFAVPAALAVLLLAAPSRADTLKVPADFATIQAAVATAVEGDVVLVSKGAYPENVVVTTAGIALRGKSATIDGRYNGNCILVQADDVEVSGFTLVNGGQSGALALQGPGDGSQFGGLHVIGTGALISKLRVAAGQDFGIELEGTGVVEKCEVDGCPAPGIIVATGNFMGSVVTVARNRVTRCTDGIELFDGPFLAEKNVCEDNLGDGLVLAIPVPAIKGIPAPQNTTISKNECRRNGGIGLDLIKGVGPVMTVDKNVAAENGTGLQVNCLDVAITNNAIERNRSGGAFLFTTNATFVGNKVRGNATVGIFLQAAALAGSDGGGVDGINFLQGNSVQDNGGDGVRVQSDSNTLDANVLKDNLGDGVQLLGFGPTANQVTGNTIIGNGHDGIDNGANATLISTNVCKDNGGADLAGIGIGSGTTDAASTGNVIGDETGLESGQELELETLIS